MNEELEELMAAAIAERDGTDNEEENNDTGSDDTGSSDATSDSATTDDDTSTDTSSDDTNDSDDSSVDNGSDDGESKNDDTNVDSDFKPIEVNHQGDKITLDSMDEIENYLSNVNSNNFNKPAASVEQQVMQQAQLSVQDLQLLADIKSGNIGAISQLVKSSGVDLVDVEDFKGEYQPQFQPKIKTDVDIVIDNIEKSPIASKFNEVVSTLPDEFLSGISANADNLGRFAEHVNNGIAGELLPLAKKEVALNGGNLLDTYIRLGNAKYADSQEPNEAPQDKNSERQISKKEQEMKDRASKDSQNSSGSTDSDISVDSIWDMSPEEIAKLDPDMLRD